MRPKTKRWAIWSACLAMLAVTLVGYGAVQRMKGHEEVAKMTAKMQTVCVGRFLIDLPADAGYYINGAFVDGFRVSWAEESHEQFAARVTAREAEINAVTNQFGAKNMESVKAVAANGFTGKIFTFGRDATHTMDGGVPQIWEGVSLEGYLHANGQSFNFIADGYDPDQANNLEQLISQLRAVRPGFIPTIPGFCFGPGMLVDPVSADMGEKIVLFAKLPGHPDIKIAFNTMAGLEPTSPGLIERRAKAIADQPLWARTRFATLRSGPRVVNGLAGEEDVMKVTETNFSLVYGFDWETAGTKDDVLAPAIHLEMSTGKNPKPGGAPVQTSLGQQALLDLWDKIISSIRVRPTEAPTAGHVPAPAGSPLGTVASAGCASTGTPCPASG